jgi:hypothetical protein
LTIDRAETIRGNEGLHGQIELIVRESASEADACVTISRFRRIDRTCGILRNALSAPTRPPPAVWIAAWNPRLVRPVLADKAPPSELVLQLSKHAAHSLMARAERYQFSRERGTAFGLLDARLLLGCGWRELMLRFGLHPALPIGPQPALALAFERCG